MHIVHFFYNLSRLLSIASIPLACISLFLACQKAPDDLSLKTESFVKAIRSNEEFEKIISSSHQKLVVIDFYADWCGPCRDLAPILENVAHEMDQSAQFYKLNIDEHRSLSMQKGVTGIPYVALFKEGKKVHSLMGLWPQKSYRRIIKRFAFPPKSNSTGKTSHKYLSNTKLIALKHQQDI